MTKSPDKLETLQCHAAEARDLELQIADYRARIKELSEHLYILYHTKLPALLNDVSLDSIGVPPDGNKPGVDYVLRPYFSASIAAKWGDEKKAEAYAVLKKYKAEDLIKTEVSAALPKGNLKAAKLIFSHIKKLGIKEAAISMNQTVHASTLTAWLREIYQRGQTLPSEDLEKIGGSVGQYVRAADRKE